MSKARKLLNLVLQFAFKRIDKFLDKKVPEESPLKEPVNKAVDFVAEVAIIYTDSNKNNSEQMKTLLEDSRDEFVETGISLLKIPISNIKDEYDRESLEEALQTIKDIILGQDSEGSPEDIEEVNPNL